MFNKFLLTLVIATNSMLCFADANHYTRRNFSNHKSNNIYLGMDLSSSFNLKCDVDNSIIFKKDGYNSSIPNYNINIGKRINKFLTLELAYNKRKFTQYASFTQEDAGISVKSYSTHKSEADILILNNYINFSDLSVNNIVPYLVIDIGISHTKPGALEIIDEDPPASQSHSGHNSVNFIGQIGIGAFLKLSNQLDLNASIKYTNNYGSIKMNELNPIKIRGFEAIIGIRYNI